MPDFDDYLSKPFLDNDKDSIMKDAFVKVQGSLNFKAKCYLILEY